jgi:predicted RNase H-like nuclease (RuvC/YqgF family)|tara:strand:- start:188 stop:433 length:246 start_codon:yes stop_codon:yes gene_type:complete
MFKKLIDFCKTNKEKQMPTTTDTRSVKALKTEIKSQKEQISRLLNRMNSMSDEIHFLKSDLGRFKKNVANDVKYLTDKVDG